MVRIEKLDKTNIKDIEGLSVELSQKRYVEPVQVFISISEKDTNCIPMVIYNDDIPVGFFVYGTIDAVYVIAGLMIDKNHQGKGYGKKAMAIIIDEIKKNKEYDEIHLNVAEKNTAAIKLYESLGFEYAGYSHFVVYEDEGIEEHFLKMKLEL